MIQHLGVCGKEARGGNTSAEWWAAYKGLAIVVSKWHVDNWTVYGKPLWSRDLWKPKAKKNPQEFIPVGLTGWCPRHPRCWGREGAQCRSRSVHSNLGVLLYLLMLCLPILYFWWGSPCQADTWVVQTPRCWCTHKGARSQGTLCVRAAIQESGCTILKAQKLPQ